MKTKGIIQYLDICSHVERLLPYYVVRTMQYENEFHATNSIKLFSTRVIVDNPFSPIHMIEVHNSNVLSFPASCIQPEVQIAVKLRYFVNLIIR